MSRAWALARTLKPKIAAFDAAARVTSDSVMAPTPPNRMRTLTSSVPMRSRPAVIASSEPCTSDLSTTGSSPSPPSRSWENMSSSVPRAPVAVTCAWSRRLRCRYSVISRARFSLSTTARRSPGSGTPSRPRISTGVEGPAVSTGCAAVVEQRAGPAPLGAGDDEVADLQRAALDQHGRDHAAAAIELGLDDRAVRLAIGVGAHDRAARPAAAPPRSACRGWCAWWR